MAEEVTLLRDKGIVKLVTATYREPTEEEQRTYREGRAAFVEHQVQQALAFDVKRRAEHAQHPAKRRHEEGAGGDATSAAAPSDGNAAIPDAAPAATREDVVDALEPSALASASAEANPPQPTSEAKPEYVAYLHKAAKAVIPTANSREGVQATSAAGPADWTFPSTEAEKMRYAVFRDLYDRGYVLTSACKFGGDFLAYPGDPNRFHSHFVVTVQPYARPLSPMDIISYGRIGTVVKKASLLASVGPEGKVRYITLNWTGAN
eukprot:m.92428 g.92428  ORF g.92428 m.92428 type:complete len:263 (-) comp15331_c0_seq4:151-939(-)